MRTWLADTPYNASSDACGAAGEMAPVHSLPSSSLLLSSLELSDTKVYEP